MKRLIVNADDYGRSPGVSAGIRQAHLNGIVTSTTVMMNYPSASSDLHLALRESPHLGLGVHLVLTSRAPVLPAGAVPSLTAGGLTFPGLAGQISRLPELDPDEVRAELRAQIERFIAVTGRKPTHLDSHHHITFYSPNLAETVVDLAHEYGCGLRLLAPNPPGVPFSGGPVEFMAAVQPALSAALDKRPAPHPDTFIATFYGSNATREAILQLLDGLPEGTTEIMCHPGFADELLLAESSYHLQREAELAVLTDPQVMGRVRENQIELLSYAGLIGGGA